MEKRKETNQRAQYARCSLTTRAVNEIIHYLIISDITEQDKNLLNIGGPKPQAPLRTAEAPVICAAFLPALIGIA
jgi:hypothetical protein